MNSPLTIPVKNALSHIVVVGNGMVGQHLVEQLVQKNTHMEHQNYRDWCRALYRV